MCWRTDLLPLIFVSFFFILNWIVKVSNIMWEINKRVQWNDEKKQENKLNEIFSRNKLSGIGYFHMHLLFQFNIIKIAVTIIFVRIQMEMRRNAREGNRIWLKIWSNVGVWPIVNAHGIIERKLQILFHNRKTFVRTEILFR